MKKILIIIAIVLYIFQSVVLATAITVGNEAVDGDSSRTAVYTRIDGTNAADGTGTITTIEIWVNSEISNCKIAIFELVGVNTFTTRSYCTLGTVTVGEHSVSNSNPITVDSESNPISLDVVEGDYIGFYGTGGAIESTVDGGIVYYDLDGDIIPCTEEVVNGTVAHGISLKGIGATAEAGRTWNSATITKFNTATITKWNGI